MKDSWNPLYGWSRLYHACWRQELSEVRSILAAGIRIADEAAEGQEYGSPLHAVAGYRRWSTYESVDSLIDLLVSHGIPIDAWDARGKTALHNAVVNWDFDAFPDPMTAAALLRHGADPNARDFDGDTPLHLAAAQLGNLPAETICQLLRYGANPTLRDGAGRTPLQRARPKLQRIRRLVRDGIISREDPPKTNRERARTRKFFRPALIDAELAYHLLRGAPRIYRRGA